ARLGRVATRPGAGRAVGRARRVAAGAGSAALTTWMRTAVRLAHLMGVRYPSRAVRSVAGTCHGRFRPRSTGTFGDILDSQADTVLVSRASGGTSRKGCGGPGP